MKHLVLIMVALFTFNVNAQPKDENSKDRPHKHDSLFKDLSVEEIADLKTKRMTADLDLNASQQEQIRAIVLEETINKQKQRDARKAKKDENDTQTPSKEERLTLINEKLDREIAMKKKMKTILDDEQYKKWEHLTQKKDKKKRGRRSKERR